MPDSPREFCREACQQAGETIGGSAAASIPFIVALEHCKPWGSKAIPESDLPDEVKQVLDAVESTLEGARPQLIKREMSRTSRSRLMLAGIEPTVRRAVQWELDDVRDLLAIDLVAAAQALRDGETPEGSAAVDTPQLLVCTNGKRDRCCAKWGMPLFRILSGIHTDTWETSHIGGHRFAPTLVWLQTGICLGRIGPDEAVPMLAAIERGDIFRADRLRGRMSFSAPAQFAEAAWREETGRWDVAAITGAWSEATPQGHHAVTLRDDGGAEHRLTVRRRPLGILAAPSCDKQPEEVAVWERI